MNEDGWRKATIVLVTILRPIVISLNENDDESLEKKIHERFTYSFIKDSFIKDVSLFIKDISKQYQKYKNFLNYSLITSKHLCKIWTQLSRFNVTKFFCFLWFLKSRFFLNIYLQIYWGNNIANQNFYIY